jgi:putative spermidine/putrescine transport system substrate-binding protein
VRAAVAGALVALAVLAAGCGGDDRDGRRLELVVGPGYVENGTGDPKADWVTPFERASGCDVRTRVALTTDELVALVGTGAYDGAAGLGDALGRLVQEGDLAPIDTGRLAHWREVAPSLRTAPVVVRNGRVYGVPQGRGANLLMWRTDVVRPAPTGWGAVFDAGSPHAGRVTGYDGPIAIADAALHLRATRPELGIEDVYELDATQFAAAIRLLGQQRLAIGNYWWDYVREQAAFAAGDAVVGTTWQFVADLLAADGVPVRAILPREGATGWVDAWMVAKGAPHEDCMYRWLDWMLEPTVNAQVAQWLGEAPSTRAACVHTADPGWCPRYHAADERWFSRVDYWRAPSADCGDGRGRVCKDWDDWAEAWEEVSD